MESNQIINLYEFNVLVEFFYNTRFRIILA